MDVGVFEAKARLSELLQRVAAGEEITITHRGRAVARLVPAVDRRPEDIRRAIDEIRDLAKGQSLQGDWKEMRDEGRKR